MLKVISLTIAVVYLLFISCSDPKFNEMEKAKPVDLPERIDSTALLVENIGKFRQGFKLQLDSSLVDTAKYSAIYYPDTTHCHSFWFDRQFLGKLSLAKASVLQRGSSETLYLQTGNLKLWVCNLPQNAKAGDTILITALVYNTLGFEKTWGYPTIPTSVRMLD